MGWGRVVSVSWWVRVCGVCSSAWKHFAFVCVGVCSWAYTRTATAPHFVPVSGFDRTRGRFQEQVKALGFRVWGSGFGVWGFGFWV